MFDGTSLLGDTGWDERAAEGYLPQVAHVTETAVLLNDGAVMGMLRLDGAPFHLEDTRTRNNRHRIRNALLRALAGDGIEVYENLVRHEAPHAASATRFAAGSYSAALDADYRAHVLGHSFANDWFVSVVVRPPTHAAKMSVNLRGLWQRRSQGSASIADEGLLLTLEDRLSVAAQALAAYGPVRLGLRENADGTVFTEVGEALRLILYARALPVPLVDGLLGASVYTDRVIFGRRGFEVCSPGGGSIGAVFGFREYPAHTKPGMLDQLLEASFPLVLTNSFRFLTRAHAQESMALKQRQMENAGDRALSQIAGLTEAMDQIASDDAVQGSHHFSLAVHAHSLHELDRVASSARAILANCGANPAAEDRGMEAAFFAQIPGARARWRTRPGAISSRNFVGLSSLDGFLRGAEEGYWGAPPFTLATSGGTEYRWHLHDGDVGHNLLVGPTGSGKTLMLGFSLAMLDPHVGGQGGTQILFDKDSGNEILVRALGGRYTTLRRGAASGAAPLRALPNTPETCAWLRDFIAWLVTSDGRGQPSPDDMRRIQRGVTFIMHRPLALRSFAGLRQFMGHTEASAGERLDRWCRGGALGWAFDNDADTIDFDAGIAAVDPTALLSDTEVMGPMAAYLLHRAGMLMDGRRVVLWADEFRAYLPDPRFARGFEDAFLTGRKKNVAMVVATQQPEHILNHPIGPSLVAQCRQRIMFKNPDAQESAYRDGLGCTPGEFRAVSEDMLVEAWSLLVKRAVGSVLCRFDLSALPQHIAVLSGRAATVRLMHRVMADLGTDDPAVWLPEFQRRLPEAKA